MQDQPFQDLLTAIIDILETGLPQDAAVLHFIHSTYGALPAQQLAALINDPDDAQAETLRELLLFPGPDTALALEPAMERARLSVAATARLAEALVENQPKAAALMPDGTRFPVPLSPERLGRFVDRLAPQRTLPEPLVRLLAERFPHDAVPLAAAARQLGPDWSPGAAAFFQTLLAKLPSETPDAPGVLRFALRFLADAPPGTPPLPALSARYSQLLAQLRRARQQEEALAKSNYETLIMAGARLPYLHAPDIARELGQAAAILEAVTGRPAVDTGASCQNMGVAASLEQVFSAFGEEAD